MRWRVVPGYELPAGDAGARRAWRARYGTQSALSDFREYTFLHPNAYAPYVGFTENEVEELAMLHDMDMTELRRWYDGYELPYFDEAANEHSMVRCYAPYSVVSACEDHDVGRYWSSSEAFKSLRFYIDLDFDGLQQAIVQAVGGSPVPVRVGKFDNDMHDVGSADEVLTLLCHLGYLAYDPKTATSRIPNEEVRAELRDALEESRHTEVARIARESDELLEATWSLDEATVAAGIAAAHDNGCAPRYYNSKQALRAVVKAAYISAAGRYATIEELPSGHGYADVVFLPRRGDPSPALVVELKWDRPVRSAIDQILDRNYPQVLRDWGGPTLLVGITYDRKTKAHACRIEELPGPERKHS